MATRPAYVDRLGMLKLLVTSHWSAFATRPVMQLLVTLVVMVALDPLEFPLLDPSRCGLLALIREDRIQTYLLDFFSLPPIHFLRLRLLEGLSGICPASSSDLLTLLRWLVGLK
jgi:hypothetical protein